MTNYHGENAGYLYIPEAHMNQVAILNCANNTIVKRILINDINIMPLGSRPTVLVATHDGKKIFSDNFGLIPPTLSVIDTESDSVHSIVLDSVPLGLFLSKDGKEFFVPQGNYIVEVFDVITERSIRKLTFADVPVAAISGPEGHLYVGFASGHLGVYDPYTGKCLKDPIWTGGNLPAWYTFNKSEEKLYVATANVIGVIDVKEWVLIKKIFTNGGAEYNKNDPWAFTVTLSPAGDKVYVTLLGEPGVLIVNTKTDRVTGRIDTEGFATGITFSANGEYGYISDLGSSLSFLRGLQGGTLVANAWIGFGIMGNGRIITFDPLTDTTKGEAVLTTPGPGISAWIEK